MSILAKLRKPTQTITITDALKKAKDKTFREFLELLESEQNLEWFLELKVSDVIALKQIKTVVDEKVSDLDQYKEAALDVISKVDVKEYRRGILSRDIIDVIGGNGATLRKVLDQLKVDKKIWSTGKTQGQRWILYKYKDQAEAENMKG